MPAREPNEETLARLGAVFDVCGTPEITRAGTYLTARLLVRCAIPAYLELFRASFGGVIDGTKWTLGAYDASLDAADALLPHVHAQREALLTWRDLRATVKRDGPASVGVDERARRDARLRALRAERADRRGCSLDDLERAARRAVRAMSDDALAMRGSAPRPATQADLVPIATITAP